MKRYTMSMEQGLYDLLVERAELNRRSINNELLFLVESALAAEIDGNQQILRMLMMAQGGPQPTRAPAERMPEHTAMGGQTGETSEPAASPA